MLKGISLKITSKAIGTTLCYQGALFSYAEQIVIVLNNACKTESIKDGFHKTTRS